MLERVHRNLEVNRRENPSERRRVLKRVEASLSTWFSSLSVCLKVEYLAPTKATREVESFLFRPSRDYYPVIGPCHASRDRL
ncbi:hypothetical protein TNCV_4898791 [Trichonephila clavipes]|nr:hypothetical protein TNCV_4898791 [Trichonephila clavipes]